MLAVGTAIPAPVVLLVKDVWVVLVPEAELGAVNVVVVVLVATTIVPKKKKTMLFRTASILRRSAHHHRKSKWMSPAHIIVSQHKDSDAL